MSELRVTVLESFPAELFIETFAYLDGYHIYLAFHGLNSRLSILARSYMVKHLDLRTTEYHQCREIFSMINRSRLIALKLSNKFSDEQIEQLFNNRLNHLRSLTLDSVKVLTIDPIIRRTDICNQLESLSIWFNKSVYRNKLCTTSAWIFKICLSYLKSLKYLSIRKHKDDDECPAPITFRQLLAQSTSMNLSCQHVCLTTVCIDGLEGFLSGLPNLQTLSLVARLNSPTFAYPMMLCLHRCKLKLVLSSFEPISNFLSHCPNLQRLSLMMISAPIDILDDKKWQSVIERYFPQLKRFEIDMWTKPEDLDAAKRTHTISFENNSFWQQRKTRISFLNRRSSARRAKQMHIIIQFGVRIN